MIVFAKEFVFEIPAIVCVLDFLGTLWHSQVGGGDYYDILGIGDL